MSDVDYIGAAKSYDLHLEALKCLDMGNLDGAEERWGMCVNMAPNEPTYLIRFAEVMARRGRWEEDLKFCTIAAALRPQDPEPWLMMGAACGNLGRHSESIRHYRTANRLAPNAPNNLWNMALWNLLHGNYKEGWEGYKWGQVMMRRRRTLQPEWDGQVDRTKPLFIWHEQGMGDLFQMLRFLKHPKVTDHEVVCLEVPSDVVPLLECQGLGTERRVNCHVNSIPFESFNHCSIMSLPGILGMVNEDDFWCGPYLRAKPSADPFEDMPGTKIGLCWKGAVTHTADAQRSISKDAFAEIMTDQPGTTFVSLVPGDNFEECLSFPLKTWDETAAIISHLDLVITVDTAVAHLAGAMGKPVWLLLSFAPDWRWCLNYPSSTHWYPSARLFRQPSFGDWQHVITSIREALTAYIRASAPTQD